jgi:tetratricopeptide (TPR) repeat protein
MFARRRNAWAVFALAVLVLVLAGCGEERKFVTAGNELYNAKKYEEAAVQYEKAIELKPDAWIPSYRLAMSYLSLFKPQSTHEMDKMYAAKARTALEHCLTLEAPHPEDMKKVQDYYLGLLVATDDLDKAIEVMEKMHEADPTDVKIVAQLANTYAKRGDFDNSLRYFGKRTELEPDNSEAWYTLGVVCWERSYRGGDVLTIEERGGIVEQGLSSLGRALELNPNSFDVLAYLNLLHRERAKVHQMAGRMAEAAADIAKADEFQKRALAVRKG